MKFFTTDAAGITLIDPAEAERLRILESVEMDADADFPEVFLAVQGGLVIGYRQGGYLSWEEEGELLRVAGPVDLPAAILAWNWAISGDMKSLLSLSWREID